MEFRERDSATLLGHPSGDPTVTDAVDPHASAKLRKKELKQLRQSSSRPLDPWEQYRALNDAMDEAYEVTDISNREARFALLVMGILNAFVAISATRPEIVGALDSGAPRMGAIALLTVYAVTAVYFLFQAIEALRPGHFRPKLGKWEPTATDYPVGIRYYEDVIQRDAQDHWRAWCEVQVAQLNADLAVQHHSLCIRSNVKRVALRRLFAGLRVMTILVVGLMMLFGYAVWR